MLHRSRRSTPAISCSAPGKHLGANHNRLARLEQWANLRHGWHFGGAFSVAHGVILTPANMPLIAAYLDRSWRWRLTRVMPDDFLDGLQAQDHATRWRKHLLAPG